MRNWLSSTLFSMTMFAVPFAASAQSAPTFIGDVVAVDGVGYEVEAVVQQVGLVNNQLVAETVNVTIINALTGEEVTSSFTGALPLDANDACGILFLDVQPIFLDLLGLQLQTSQIVLDLSAVTGSGRLLGNLLCAVVGLLDAPGNFIQLINDIVDAINTILDGLG